MAIKPPKPGAGETQADNTQTPEPVERLREKYKIGRAVYAGACAAYGWRPGKVLTGREFLDGVAAFSGTPMGGSPGKEREGA